MNELVPSASYHHSTRILCDTCHRTSMHDTQSEALEFIDQHILDSGHQVSYYLSPSGWLVFGGIG